MKPTTTPSAKAEASDAIGRSEMMLSRLSFLLAQGLAEIVERRLDLICESLGAILPGVEDFLARGGQQARHDRP